MADAVFNFEEEFVKVMSAAPGQSARIQGAGRIWRDNEEKLREARRWDRDAEAYELKRRREFMLARPEVQQLHNEIRSIYSTVPEEERPDSWDTTLAPLLPGHLEGYLNGIGKPLTDLDAKETPSYFGKFGVARGTAVLMSRLFTMDPEQRLRPGTADRARASFAYTVWSKAKHDPAALDRELDGYDSGINVILSSLALGEAPGLVESADTEDPRAVMQASHVYQLARAAKLAPDQAARFVAQGRKQEEARLRAGNLDLNPAQVTQAAVNYFETHAAAAAKVPGYFTALEALQGSGALQELAHYTPQEQATYIAQVAPFAAQPWLQHLDEGTRGAVHKVQLRAQGAPVAVSPEEEQRAQSALRRQAALTVTQTAGAEPSLQGAALVADSILHDLLDTPTQRPVEGDAQSAVERIQAYQLAHQQLDETESRLSSALLEVGNFESQEQAMQAMHQVANLGLLLHPRSDPARAAALAGRVLASQAVAVEQLGIEIQGDELIKALQDIASYSGGGSQSPDNALDRARLDAQRIRRPGGLLSSETQAQELFSQYQEVGSAVASVLTDLIEIGGKMGWSSAEFLKTAAGRDVKLPDGKRVTLGVLAERNPTFAKLLQGIAAGDHLTFEMHSGATWQYGTPEPPSTAANVLTAINDSLSTLLFLPKSTDWAVPAFQPDAEGYASRSRVGKAAVQTAYGLGAVGSALWGRKGLGAQIGGGVGDLFSRGHYHRTVNDPFGFTDLVTDLFASQGTVSPMPLSGKVGVNPDVSYQTKHTGGGGVEAVAAARKTLASVLEKQGANSPKLQYMLELAPVAAAKEIVHSQLTFDQKYHGAAYREAVQAFFPAEQQASTLSEVVADARAGLKSQWEAQVLIDSFNREADRQSRERQTAITAQAGLQRAQMTADTQRYRVDETEAGRDRRFQPRH